jgi:N utilization substance protein B
MGVRRRGRELALQALYQVEFCGDDPGRTVAAFWERCDASADARDFGAVLVGGVLAERRRIDELIGGASEHWRLGRLSTVDLNVLRVGTYELLCSPDVPPSVVIDEAIEIAKRFGTDDSGTFVNGVLDQVATALGVKAKAEGAR